jgi:hypothetical protein
MNNIIVVKNTTFNLEKVWRQFKTDYTRDVKGKLFPFPKHGKKWDTVNKFTSILKSLNEYLHNGNKYIMYDKPRHCLICNKKNITTRRYYNMNIMWEDGLIHYIDKHFIEPSIMFKKFIYQNKTLKKLSRIKTNKYENKKDYFIIEKIKKQTNDYVMITKNQLHILDALMIHGGYHKKYIDKNINRYSEHAGILDFDKNILSKIIVSGKTNRIDTQDDEIYLPDNMNEMLHYEYIFHTHPPTPKPGGRVSGGILYEFPSIGDIYHFINHHNKGNVIGSLVIAAEGLYNIRKNTTDINDIIVDDNILYNSYQDIFTKVQKNSIRKYGYKFSNNTFYSDISQNTKYINDINNVLNKFNIQIDYYPRTKGKHNTWYIDTVFLVFRKNKKN